MQEINQYRQIIGWNDYVLFEIKCVYIYVYHVYMYIYLYV